MSVSEVARAMRAVRVMGAALADRARGVHGRVMAKGQQSGLSPDFVRFMFRGGLRGGGHGEGRAERTAGRGLGQFESRKEGPSLG